MLCRFRSCAANRGTVRAVFTRDQYELLDFGDGRKLERFGSEVLDRPSPAAAGVSIAAPGVWGTTTARFELEKGGRGQWDNDGLQASGEDGAWSVSHGDTRLLLQLNPSGNVGIFPEQAPNWDWIADRVRSDTETLGRAPKVLNLFAYTGGASLAAAIAGAEVTHVDSSGPTVAWAKRNAGASGAADLPVRWLVEDAMKFVARECRRGNRYDGIIADPPTYGHGPKGKPFKFTQHLDSLIEMCGELLNPGDSPAGFLLFSCHSPGFGERDAIETVSGVLPSGQDAQIEGLSLGLNCSDGRQLYAGVAARWSSQLAGRQNSS